MKNHLFNKRIPTVFGIALVILGIVLTTIIVRNQTSTKSQAENSQEPQNIKITNVSNNSFTITYQTDAPATGSISYGKDKKLGESELEDLDKEKGSFSPKKIHSISITKLTPATKYFLAVVSGENTFLNNSSPFEILTGPNISSSAAKESIIKGRILLPDGNPPSEALVYLNAEKSQLLSDVVTKDGTFDFSLKELRINNLSSYFDLTDETVLKIFATNGSLESTALISIGKNVTIPTITLSNDYDFTQSSSPIASKSGEPLGFPSIVPLSTTSKPQILTPTEDQSFNSQKPQFRGTSLPNEKIEIVIHSDEAIIDQVTADSNGNWTYVPPSNLSPGVHTITIKTRDSSGILTTLKQSFTVFAAESQVTPTPTIKPTATPTPLPISAPIVIVPTDLPLPTFIPIESGGGLPPTGSVQPLLLAIGGIIVTIAGIALFLLTRTMI